jgi:hypothetical protein
MPVPGTVMTKVLTCASHRHGFCRKRTLKNCHVKRRSRRTDRVAEETQSRGGIVAETQSSGHSRGDAVTETRPRGGPSRGNFDCGGMGGSIGQEVRSRGNVDRSLRDVDRSQLRRKVDRSIAEECGTGVAGDLSTQGQRRVPRLARTTNVVLPCIHVRDRKYYVIKPCIPLG